MRVAAIQMNSGSEVEANLDTAGRLIKAAAADGARLVALPENFALMPVRSRDKSSHAESPGRGPIQAFLAETARRHGVWIIGGTIPLESPEAGRVYGACPVFDDKGEIRATYLKIHLFDIDVPGSGESYRESNSMYPGDEHMVCDTPAGRVGLTVCYDVRFPELYRQLVDDGATLFTVPAAFTLATGKAHWHTLLKARAIENLCYVIAPGQSGTHPDQRSTYGHSLIIDPWGRVLAELEDGEGFVVADVDRDAQEKLRREAPMLDNRRFELTTRIKH